MRARTRSTGAEGESPVRVYTHTMERPVEEHIRLREERFRGQPSISAFESIEPDFQQHFARTFRQSGIAYGECAAAYRYGYELARRERDSGDWETIESEARQEWEQRNPGSWDRFKRAIRYAWDRARSATRAA